MIEYIRELNRNYLKIQSENYVENYCMKMVENNNISGFINAKVNYINNSHAWLYDISGMRTMADKYEKKDISLADINSISEFIKTSISNCEKYLLDPDGLCFDPAYIFIGQDNTFHVIYNTTLEASVREELKSLFEFVLGRLDHKDQRAVVLGYGIYKTVCAETVPIEKIFDFARTSNEVIKEEQLNESEDVLSGNKLDNVHYSTGFEYTEQGTVNNDILPETSYTDIEKNHGKRIVPIMGALVLVLFFVGVVTELKILYILCGVVAFVGTFLVRSGKLKKYETAKKDIPYTNLSHKLRPVSSRKDEKFDDEDDDFVVGTGASKGNFRSFADKTAQRTNNDFYRETMPINESTATNESAYETKYERDYENISKQGNKFGNVEQSGTVLLSFFAKLVEYKGSTMEIVQEYPIYDSPVILGSSDSADIYLSGAGISRNHARLSREGEMFFIKDLNSTNGTWVNEHRLNVYEMCPVKEQDIIRLAGSRYGISIDY